MNGLPLVYLNPAGGAQRTPVLAGLADTHKIYRPTFPGSDTPRALANRVADHLEREIGKPCDVIGCSLGGAVALWLAIDRPACVDHLVLCGVEDGKDSDLIRNLSKIEAKTLILHGTEDRITGKESVQLLKSRLRRAYLVYLWHAAHDLEADQPERTLALVRSFLERSDAFMVNYA